MLLVLGPDPLGLCLRIGFRLGLVSEALALPIPLDGLPRLLGRKGLLLALDFGCRVDFGLLRRCLCPLDRLLGLCGCVSARLSLDLALVLCSLLGKAFGFQPRGFGLLREGLIGERLPLTFRPQRFPCCILGGDLARCLLGDLGFVFCDKIHGHKPLVVEGCANFVGSRGKPLVGICLGVGMIAEFLGALAAEISDPISVNVFSDGAFHD